MEEKLKKIAWINVAALGFVVIGAIFGVLAAFDLEKVTGSSNLKYIILATVIVIAIILLVTGTMSFLSARNGNVKSSILATGKYSSIQNLGPTACFILALVGLIVRANETDTDVNKGALFFLIGSFVIVLFALGFSTRGLKAYRKDKETFTFISFSSFFAVIALLVFGIGSVVAMLKIPGIENSNAIGFLEVFAVMFTLADLLSYLCLGLMTLFAQKYAPKVTMADADSKAIYDLNENVNKLASNIEKKNEEEAKPQEKDKFEQIREYKKLLDEGIISEEEFEEKKKELL